MRSADKNEYTPNPKHSRQRVMASSTPCECVIPSAAEARSAVVTVRSNGPAASKTFVHRPAQRRELLLCHARALPQTCRSAALLRRPHKFCLTVSKRATCGAGGETVPGVGDIDDTGSPWINVRTARRTSSTESATPIRKS